MSISEALRFGLAGSEAEKRWNLPPYLARIICSCIPPAYLTVNMIYGQSVVVHANKLLLLQNATR